MAEFNPPDSHWAADFDGRLVSSFYHLKDENRELRAEVTALRALIEQQNNTIAQGLADARAYAGGTR